MKVLVCIPCLLTGGTEVQTLSLVEALVAAGHEPVVACYFEYAETMVERYRCAGADVRLLSPEGKRPIGIKANTKHLWRGLRNVVKAINPEVAHVQYMAPGALPILILRLLGVKRIIATTHTDGDIYSKNGLRIIRFMSKHFLTAFQCITERAEKTYFRTSSLFDGTLKKHFTIYNNIPSHIEIRYTSRPKLADDALITIGVVSRLEYIKGMDLVVPAFAKVAKVNPYIRLLVVGDGTLRKLMERQTTESGCSDRITFVGRRPQSELQDYYDIIDILLMPSRSEGFGLTAIEGMARGCVPVVSNTGGLPEVITSDCGLLHQSDNMENLAHKISSVVSDVKLIKTYSDNAIVRSMIFSTENYRTAIKQLYFLI